MEITTIRKRDGSHQPYQPDKITSAIYAAMRATRDGLKTDAEDITHQVNRSLASQAEVALAKGKKTHVPSVEAIQDQVEMVLMSSEHRAAAKAYILYREQHRQARQRDIFKKRVALKPYEYPELAEFTDAIRHSYWVHTEFNFTSDIQDFKVNATAIERAALQRTMLAIAQIEVAVKAFWGDLFKRLPKPEIGAVGYTFAESEVRHHDAYSHLLEILGLNDEFTTAIDTPALRKRVEYLARSLETAKSDIDQDYMRSILLFSLFIEHVSLFSQFLIIMSFNKHRNMFKGISNAVEATSKEEQIHGLFGIEIIKTIKKEHPDWFDDALADDIAAACHAAYAAEVEVVDWIFEDGELSFLPKADIQEFIKGRLNNSLASLGYPRLLPVDERILDKTEWFNDEIIGTKHGDFFVKRSVNYNKRSRSITSEDLF